MNSSDEKNRIAKGEKARFERWILCLHGLAVIVLGLSFVPMVAFLYFVWKAAAGLGILLKLVLFCFSLSFGYFMFGIALILLCVGFRRLLGFKIAPGLYTIHSKEALDWMGYNSLILIANSAFLDVLRLSPFQTLFYRAMGAKVGDGVNINTGGLADLQLLEIGDQVLIGGGVALICHGSERGFLRLAPTRIGSRVSIGLNTVIMPDVEIGEGASIAPCSYLPKGTRIPARGVWGGNPVQDLRLQRRQALQAE